MLGKASVIKTRNQVKDIPVHQERFFSFMTIPLVYLTNILKKSKKKKSVHHTKRHKDCRPFRGKGSLIPRFVKTTDSSFIKSSHSKLFL